MNISQEEIGKIVAENFSSHLVFERHNMEYYRKGNRSLEESAKEAGIDVNKIISEIEKAPMSESKNQDALMNEMPLDKLCDYITVRFHRGGNADLELIRLNLEKVCRDFGKQYPQLIGVRDVFALATAGMNFHQVKEEITLFPFIKKMLHFKDEGKRMPDKEDKAIKGPMSVLEDEHDMQDNALKGIAKMLDDYTAPDDADNLFKATIDLIRNLEKDLHLHIHSENNILFPKALELYDELKQE